MLRTRSESVVRAGVLAAGMVWTAAAFGMDTLHVLTWPGYADPDIVAVFEARYHVRVEVTYVDSDEGLWDKMHAPGSGGFDVVAANTAEISRYVRDGLLAPLDVAELPNTRRQLARFQARSTIPGLIRGDKLYAIPYTYSTMGLIFDRKQFKSPPRSMAELWNPRYRHRVLAFNSAAHSFSLTALTLGIANPFQLDRAQMRRVALRLVALRRNVLSYYNLPEEATDLFVRHHIALLFANYGTQQLTQLRKAGADVGYAIPGEGVLAWLDCWATTRHAPDPKLAAEWINYMLEPDVAAALSTRQGLANTLDAPNELAGSPSIVWLAPVEDAARREVLWRRIVSGDRPARF